MSLENDNPRETENDADTRLPNDPLIDALLEEIIGGQSPPDLATQILSQLHDSLPTTTQPPVNDLDSIPTPKSTVVARHRARRRSFAVPISMALSVTAITLALVAIALNSPSNSTNSHGVANNQTQPSEKPSLPIQQSNDNSTDSETLKQETPNSPQIATSDNPHSTRPIGPSDVNTQAGGTDALPPVQQRWQHPLALADTNTVVPVETDIILSRIRRELEKKWNENGVSPSEVAVNLEWARRVYLRLIGRVPTTDELERFNRKSKQPAELADARQQLVDTLLYGDIYQTEFTQHWSTFWTNALIGRQGGLDGDNANRGGLQQYLRESFAANKPYDEMVFELISAIGAADAESEQFNGAVNFLLASLTKNDTTLATSRISSIFLGQKLQCAQCHHHPTSDIAQDHFWELDAFLSGVQATKVNGQTILTNVDSNGVKTPDGRVGVFFERPNGIAQMVFPAFLGHPPNALKTTAAAESSTGDQAILREQLAQLTSESPLLARTLVNRLWSHFLGFGFTPSVDDMGPHLAVSHPQLLLILSEQTESSNYDLKSLMKWIVLSDPFTRSSKYSASNDIDSPELGDQPLFSRYYSRQLEPEEVYQSLLVLSGKTRSATTIGQQQLAQRTWLGQFTKPMGTDEGDETNSFDGNVHQSLVLMNGDLMKQATSITSTSVLGKIIKSPMPVNNKIDHLFLAAVARYPSANEKKLILALFAKPDVSPEQIYQDIWWALLNSNEFILDH
jgi:hypothetical protein